MDNVKIKNENVRHKYNQDICGQELLKLVARGSAIIAEILRLKDYIPELYFNQVEEKKYSNIIFDFTYFKNVDYYEDKIMNSIELRNLDEEFRENYLEVLERFFMLFYSIYQYITDWDSYTEQVNQGVFIQHTIESILSSKEIRHLLCESIYSYGVMLLLVDRLIPGPIREKIIVSYYRYKGQSTIQNFEQLVILFKDTGYVAAGKAEEIKPKLYPIDYFKRLKVDGEIVKLIVGTIKDNDIYDQIGAYPSVDHRSHALSNQAAVLFVTLFFIPDYLNIENSKMREIVDKHFSDNWVISIYMGYTVDILEYWKDFKAAKNALAITINMDIVKSLKKNYHTKLTDYSEKLKKFLFEGLMNEDYVLDNINVLLNIMRDSNVILRWFLLQRTTTNRKYKDLINENLKLSDLINLLFSISHFEYLLKNMFQTLIKNKESMWNEDKQSCMYRLKELSEYFAGNKNFGKQVKQDEYKEFFDTHYKNLEELEFINSTTAGRKIILIKESLEKIKMYYYVEGNLQIKQYINEIAQYLNHMLRIVNVKNVVLINIAQISDFSYAWIVLQEYSSIMQNFLKEDSKSVLLLRATFLKLASILNFPLVRLFEIESPDIESVTNYYSGELVKFVGNILQIVSKSVFILHDNIINIFTKGFLDLPIKILKSDLKDYAQFEDRHTLAKNTHQISLFTKGILMMEKTLMGVIEVDPKNILEEGIRKELLNLLAGNFNKYIDFTAGYNVDLNLKLTDLAKRISCIKRSFLYIQDYININGSRMWYEEMHRMIYYYVDLEANKFLSKKLKLDSKYDTSKYPIPKYPPLYRDFESYTFIGRLVRYIISVTKPKVALFYPSTFTWYDAYSKEIISMKTLNLIKQSMGIEGIQGLNKLFSYSIFHLIQTLKKSYNTFINDKNNHKNLKTLTTLLSNPCIIDYAEKDTLKNLMTVFGLFSKPISTTFTPIILNLGHLQILKMMACHSLKESVEVDSHVMNSQMENLNKINLHILKSFIEFKFNSDDPENKNAQNNKEKDFKYFKLLCEIFEDFGFTNSSQTLYDNLSTFEHMIIILALTTYNEVIYSYTVDKKGNITKKYKNDDFDVYYFINGIMVILQQMGRNNVIFFISFITYLIKQNLVNQYTLKDSKRVYDKNPNIPINIVLMQYFLQELANSYNIDLKMFEINSHLYLLYKSISYD